MGFSFHNRKRDGGTVRALRKPADAEPSHDAEPARDTHGQRRSGASGDTSPTPQGPLNTSDLSESPGAVSSPEEEREAAGAAALDESGFIPLHEIVAMQWYYVDKNKQQQGPMSVQSLTAHWKDGRVHENSYVWAQGMGEWVKLNKMPDLLLVLTHA